MSMVRTVVNRPTTMAVIFSLLVIFGAFTALNLAVDLIPDINFPMLVVFSSYSGAGPEQVEKTITRPLEAQLSNVSNLTQISSTSSEGSTMIILEFTYGTNMAEAANDVRDRLEFVKQIMPDEATTPMIFKFDPSIIPILRLKISGNKSPEDLREIAEDFIQPRLEQVDGVAIASVSGGRERVVRVDIPQSRLEAYNIGITQIRGALMANNLQISAGSISEGGMNYLVRSSGEFVNIEEIKNTIVTFKGTPPSPMNPAGDMVGIRLRDIANVADGYKAVDTAIFINGEPGVFVTVQKQSGKNSVQVADRVLSRLEDIKKSLPVGVEVGIAADTTTIIKRSLSEVSSSALMGLFLAVFILFVFLRSRNSTLVIFFSIPISLIITLMIMYFFNFTLNLLTLAGLALGIGMLVDNSIVVLENIYRYREKGAKLHTSAILGTQEMMVPIIASTLTTICVFLPLALFRNQLEFMGEMFSGLAFTIVISLSTSLVVAIFLVPVLAGKYFPITTRLETVLPPRIARIDNVMNRFFNNLENFYKKILSWVMIHKKIVLLSVSALFIGSCALIPVAGFELMPTQDQDAVNITMDLPVGTSIETTEKLLFQMEKVIKEELTSYKDIILIAGQGGMFSFGGGGTSNKGSITINLPVYSQRKEDFKTVQAKLRKHFGDFPGATFSFRSGGGGGFGSTSPIVITFKSEDREMAKDTGNKVLTILKEKVPEATEPVFNLQEGLPEVKLIIDREKVYSLGLNMASVGTELKANIDGVAAGKYRSAGSEMDIFLILEERSRNQRLDLDKIFVLNPQGQKIKVSSFAKYGPDEGPVTISRENQSRYLRITAGVAPGASVTTIIPKIQQFVAEEIPPNDKLLIEYGGDFEDILKYIPILMGIVLISLLLVYGVMASLFESFLDPFLVMFTIPLTMIGVVGIHLAMGEIMSIFTIVGLVMLLGIVVNNGIVLVDYTNLMRKRGMSIREACIEAGKNRLRPILMTTLTTILGLLPVAFIKSEGSSLIQPLGKTVVGGLFVSTLMTLFVIPALYEIFNRWSDKRKEKKQKKHEAMMAIRVQRLRERKEAGV
ncbi:MAG: efflux RND transporter permease subunit [Spirochaetales bacterium]|nr:efflux RND transporter permease subunit [Spirochaetales bacterium]